MYCKRVIAYLLNKHQHGVQLGLNLIIHCFDFIWNKTKHNDAAFWQVLVCLRHKLHHPVCSDVQSSLLELYCTLKCSMMPCFQAFCHKNTSNAREKSNIQLAATTKPGQFSSPADIISAFIVKRIETIWTRIWQNLLPVWNIRVLDVVFAFTTSTPKTKLSNTFLSDRKAYFYYFIMSIMEFS